jgi:hypothetical protein
MMFVSLVYYSKGQQQNAKMEKLLIDLFAFHCHSIIDQFIFDIVDSVLQGQNTIRCRTYLAIRFDVCITKFTFELEQESYVVSCGSLLCSLLLSLSVLVQLLGANKYSHTMFVSDFYRVRQLTSRY